VIEKLKYFILKRFRRFFCSINIEHFRMKMTPKNAEIFHCVPCDYKCCKQSEYNRHKISAKHQNRTNLNENDANKFICKICKKMYKARNSLWYHEQKCKPHNENTTCETTELKEIMNYLIKENSDLKTMMLDVVKNSNTIIYNNNINNSNNNNKSFNLNLFLNETCKDAMNITDFINSIKLQLSDLEKVGEVGYIDGITNIIVKNLKGLDVTQRPIHCTDSKREVLYVKDENKWEKENEENKKIRKAIKHIAYKNTCLLKSFREKHPDCGKSESKYSDQYNKLIIEAMGGKGDDDLEKEDKIIKKIAKEVVLEK
jgi:hypothetical protein